MEKGKICRKIRKNRKKISGGETDPNRDKKNSKQWKAKKKVRGKDRRDILELNCRDPETRD